jgi:hypothetical protein
LRKIITKELADLYYANYKYVNFTLPELLGPTHVTQRGNLPLFGYTTSSFKDKLSLSLYQLIGLVKSGEESKWHRRVDNYVGKRKKKETIRVTRGTSAHQEINYHSWLSVENKRIIYDTRGREDDFCLSLCEEILEAYTSDGFEDYYHTLMGTEEHKRNLKALIDYYTQTNYYYNCVKKYDFLGFLPQQDWEKMSKSRYSKAVLSICNSEPVFEVGELVLPRASFVTQDYRQQQRLKARTAPTHILILSNNEKTISAVKGGRRYKVVSIGDKDTEPFYVEERYIKKNRKLNE